ncbi:SCO2522 family protein [Actinoplanes sp. NPDC048988]|uniref:SCO2522 family protein n=1 Tax=Actinoplanes sp. NPDC048988 TaxID=3363901 RepID=UPI0037169498
MTRSVALSHLSLELGHLYMDDFEGGEKNLREQFRRVRPWAETASRMTEAAVTRSRPRISTCFLIDDYFTRFSTPRDVVTMLVEAARAEGLTIDYVARESGCARAGDVDVARLVQDHLVDEPAEGANGRPATKITGWLSNGERSPSAPTSAMAAPRQWQPARQSAVQNHSIFVDVELWSDRPDGDRLWSCPFLAAVWQLQRLGLVRRLGEPIAEPEPGTPGELPAEWDRMPPVVRLNPQAAPFRAYRSFTAMDARFLPIELAVRTILGAVAIDPVAAAQVRDRARAEGLDLPEETVGRIGYALL